MGRRYRSGGWLSKSGLQLHRALYDSPAKQMMRDNKRRAEMAKTPKELETEAQRDAGAADKEQTNGTDNP